MGMLQIAMDDTELIKHLKSGGTLRDPVALSRIQSIVQSTLSDTASSSAARSVGFDTGSLVELYVVVTESIMPEPLVWHGKDIIATTLAFQSTEQFPAFVQLVTAGGVLHPIQDRSQVHDRACDLVRNLMEGARSRHPSATLATAKTGCGILVVGVVSTLGGVGCSLLASFS